ncbi:MAG: glycosyltransferase family 4 protein [Bacteroides sp.]|nr:glycosyltransferase family 4 protein [Bacteroides sp.]MCM1380229.1 glycosyltransferase family 4 protein [Bacteroides sp.]MCM1446537.1 glycosyltransferase family 4 protein [Prevotella sp.]
MKILHAVFQMNTGGLETMLVDIANEQVRQGHEVELLIVNRGENADVMKALSSSVSVVRFNRTPGAAPLLLMLRLNAFVLKRRPDIIHLHMHKLTGLLRVMRSRALFTLHCLDIPMTYARNYNMAAISQAVADDVTRRVSRAKVTVVNNGINVDTIDRREPANPHRPVRIVQVSRLVADTKGQDILIDAARILGRRGIDVALTFIGGGADLEALRERAHSLNVEFTGNLPRREIYARLKDYDIMCHPARHEGFGLTVAEGMAAGLPLAVPEGGGPWEVADCGRLAEVFAPGDPESCADALERIIRNYPAALNRAAQARDYVEVRYSLRRQVADYLALYRTLK